MFKRAYSLFVDISIFQSNLQQFVREWQPRRVIITKEIISFAFTDGSENQIDHIPFAEVDFVKEMEDIAGDKRKVHDDRFRLQIATVANGYNSGRAYYLSTTTQTQLDELIEKMSKNAKAARIRAEAKTVFRKLQLKIRIRYESNHFQGWMALMIGAVSAILCDSSCINVKTNPLFIAYPKDIFDFRNSASNVLALSNAKINYKVGIKECAILYLGYISCVEKHSLL